MPAAAVSFSPDFRQRLEWSERLRDGYVVSIRPIRPGDAQREREFLARLPSEFRAYRFLGLIKRPDDAVAHELTHVDPACEFALVAIARNDEVGVAQYRTRGNGTCCDCSVTVDPRWQQRGVGRLLMLHLIDVARWRGLHPIASARGAYNRGNQRLFVGDLEGAVRAYQESLDLYPGYVGGYRGLGLAYAQKGNTAAAIRALRKYLKLAPSAPDSALIARRIELLSRSSGH